MDRNEIINYELTYPKLSYEKSVKTGLVQTKFGEYLTVLCDGTDLHLIIFSQEGEYLAAHAVGAAMSIHDFYFYDNQYYILSQNENGPNLIVLDLEYNIVDSKNDFKDYFNSEYNKIDSLIGFDFYLDELSGDMMIGGHLISFGNQLNFVVALNSDLFPLWYRIHLFDASTYAIEKYNDLWIYSGKELEKNFIIIEDSEGNQFSNYTLGNFRDKKTCDITIINENIILTGSSEWGAQLVNFKFDTKLERMRNKSLKNEYAEGIMSIRNKYNNLVTLGIDKKRNLIFASERNQTIEQQFWCNEYVASEFEQPLNIIEDKDIGYAILSMYSNDQGQSFQLRLIKTDEEGATRQSPFNDKCQ